MNRQRYSNIAHADHLFANPISEESVDRVLQLVGLRQGDRVIDVGCGNAEVLIRGVEKYGVIATGIDPNETAMEEARKRASSRIDTSALSLLCARAEEVTIDREAFDLAICLGANHAFGGYRETLDALKSMVRPGGHVLVAEGYWKQEPSKEYLEFLGAARDEMGTHSNNVATARARGLHLQYAIVSSDRDWDNYEGLYLRGIERWAADNPSDEDADEFLARIRSWHDVYLRWGRGTLGFALYLFRREGSGKDVMDPKDTQDHGIG